MGQQMVMENQIPVIPKISNPSRKNIKKQRDTSTKNIPPLAPSEPWPPSPPAPPGPPSVPFLKRVASCPGKTTYFVRKTDEGNENGKR